MSSGAGAVHGGSPPGPRCRGFAFAPTIGPRAVLVPVKAFTHGKRRLDPVLNAPDREMLVRRMAARVLAAAAPLPVAVVCDDPGVAQWAREHGALVVWEPGGGLSAAVEYGVEHLAGLGAEIVTVTHADLPLASGLGTLPELDGVTLVPDRHHDGTNVIRVPARSEFRFSYGPGSFQRHQAECRRIAQPCHILEDPTLSVDVDRPEDLCLIDHCMKAGRGTAGRLP
ncbi:MAG: 2-phospho-L-lactate guanylyltransferase [Actinomycetota bacterium]|nr:2-phospho-L-lactate guanylyltransferase [Actinomycetota bacterium]